MLSAIERLARTHATVPTDGLARVLAPMLRGYTMISTQALCQLVGMNPAPVTYQRIARAMTALGWSPIARTNLPPGGRKRPMCRGWMRPNPPKVAQLKRRAKAASPSTSGE